MWAEEEVWVKFRNTRHPAHVPSNISTLVQQKFLKSSDGKRKQTGTEEVTETARDVGDDNIVIDEAGEQIILENQTLPATPVKKFADTRRW
jgi:hypothetical protein